MNVASLKNDIAAGSLLERVKADRLERELLAMPQADIRTQHVFLPGIYERTITIPPWTVLTGAGHKTPYTVRLEKGTIAVNTDAGMKILTAPCEFAAPAGVKRVGRVFGEEVIWTDVYANPDNCRDLAALESRLYDLENCELGENRVARLVEQDRKDYELFLSQIGMPAEEVWAIASNESDLVPMPEGYFVELRDSKIHGKGIFAQREFAAGETIAPGRLNGKRTPVGRFMNHSCNPNATTIKGDNGDLSAMATRRIQENEEIVIDYRNSMRINFGITLQGEAPCQVG